MDREAGPANAHSLLPAVSLVYPVYPVSLVYPGLCIHTRSILQNTPLPLSFLSQRDLKKKSSVEKSQSSVKHIH